MATLKELHLEQLWLDKNKRKVVNAITALDYFQRELGFVHNCQLYKERNALPDKKFTVMSPVPFVFLSKARYTEQQTQLERILKSVQQLVDEKITGKFSYHDLSWEGFMHSPGYIVKQGGQYNERGYPTFVHFYIPQGEKPYLKVTPEGDAEGFFFHYNGHKTYYYRFPESEEDSSTAPPKKKAKKKTTKVKHTEPVPPSAVGSSHTSLPKTGHGLDRLLAEAKDPPVLEFRGSINVIKGFRRRALEKYGTLILGSTSTYHWGKAHHNETVYCMFSFETVSKRKQFLQECSLQLPDHRVGNLAGWA